MPGTAGNEATRHWTRSGEDTCGDLKSWTLDFCQFFILPGANCYGTSPRPPAHWHTITAAKEGKTGGVNSITRFRVVDQVERMPLVFPVPPLSTKGANLVAFFFSASYVVSLYLSRNARLGNSLKSNCPNASVSQNRTRDDPTVIRARMLAASTSTVLSCAVVFLLVWHIVDDLENVSDPNLVTTATQ